MKIDFLTAGIDSLEVSLEHLNKKTDKNLRIAILLGYHGISCFLKVAALGQGISVAQGNKSIQFPTLIGALKAKGWIDSDDNKVLTILNELRNALEHREVHFERDLFQIAISSSLPIVERVVRESRNLDLQDVLNSESWNILMNIHAFYEHRENFLDEIVEAVLDRSWGEDSLLDPSKACFCENCFKDGLPWKGTSVEELICKFCGEISYIACCEYCTDGVIVSKKSEWPYFHEDCFKNAMDSWGD